MEDIGALNKVEENIHTVPYGDRSGEIIEPWLTDQWFVNAKELSKSAIEKVKTKETKFIPQSWEKHILSGWKIFSHGVYLDN